MHCIDKMFTEFLEKADKNLLARLLVKYEHSISKRVIRQNPTWAEFGRMIVRQTSKTIDLCKMFALLVFSKVFDATRALAANCGFYIMRGLNVVFLIFF